MTENEFVVVDNLAKLRIIKHAIRDCIPVQGLDDDAGAREALRIVYNEVTALVSAHEMAIDRFRVTQEPTSP